MIIRDPELRLKAAPFLNHEISTPRLMLDVIVALSLPILAGLWFFGISALLVMAVTTAGAMLTEWFFTRPKKNLLDNSAALTGVLLGLVLPPGIPLWMAFIGAVVGVGLGKVIWGGLGQNVFNPALVGRGFLQAAFPGALTTWSAPAGGDFLTLRAGTLAAPLMQADVDAVTTATPLALMKFEHQATEVMALLYGNTGGSIGETSALLLIIGGLYLLARRAFDWRIPASILGTVAVFSAILFAISPERYPTPWFMLLSGGLLLGAIYMATDPVTSPITVRGAWIFGAGVGVLVVLIRLFGGLPEGVMYAILLMNAATPLIERYTQPRAFGRERSAA